MGDFNIKLVIYDSHPETSDFINLMVSHYLLPHILHPTRVADYSATITDNIFFKNSEFDTLSGNILTKISDHFPQFLVINMLQLFTRIVLYFSMTTQNLVTIYFWKISGNSLRKISLIIRIQTSTPNLNNFMTKSSARSEFFFGGWQAVSLGGGVTVMGKREILVGWVTKVCLKCTKKLG